MYNVCKGGVGSTFHCLEFLVKSVHGSVYQWFKMAKGASAVGLGAHSESCSRTLDCVVWEEKRELLRTTFGCICEGPMATGAFATYPARTRIQRNLLFVVVSGVDDGTSCKDYLRTFGSRALVCALRPIALQ